MNNDVMIKKNKENIKIKNKIQTSNNVEERYFGKELINEINHNNNSVSSMLDNIKKAKITKFNKNENITIINNNKKENKENKSFNLFKSKNNENLSNNITKNNNIQPKINIIKKGNIPLVIRKNNILINKNNVINNKIEYKKNPLEEYDESIMKNLFLEENKNRADYEEIKKSFSERDLYIRYNSINFIIYMSEKFNLTQETIYLAINLYDRCILKFKNYNNIKLFTFCCIFIAAKYEEIYPPLLEEYSEYFTIPKSELLKLENIILSTTNFDLHIHSPYLFISKFFHSSTEKESKEIFYLAQLILDLSTILLEFCSFKPSFQAAICLYIARFLFYRKKGGKGNILWGAQNAFITGYSEFEIKKNAKISIKMVQQFLNGKLVKDPMKSAFLAKYSGKNYLGIASILKGSL